MTGAQTFSGIDVTTSCYVVIVNWKFGEPRDGAIVVRVIALTGQTQSCFAT